MVIFENLELLSFNTIKYEIVIYIWRKKNVNAILNRKIINSIFCNM